MSSLPSGIALVISNNMMQQFKFECPDVFFQKWSLVVTFIELISASESRENLKWSQIGIEMKKRESKSGTKINILLMILQSLYSEVQENITVLNYHLVGHNI